MGEDSFVITLTGPSQSGKSLVTKKIKRLEQSLKQEQMHFMPVVLPKYTTRLYRTEELEIQDSGAVVDICSVPEIPENCDLVYQTYGVRYGVCTNDIRSAMERGQCPVLIVNDVRAVEELKREFCGKVLSLFLFRKIPELNDFKEEAKNRGNVSESEILARYEKAIAIYRIFIENIALFDRVILNAVEYKTVELEKMDTIIDSQLKNIIMAVLDKKILLQKNNNRYPCVFVVAGNAASGKDEIVRAILSMGRMEAEVIPKYTMRSQEPEDGREMICSKILKKDLISKYNEQSEYEEIKMRSELDRMAKTFPERYRFQLIEFSQQLIRNTKSGQELVWDIIGNEVKQSNHDKNMILDKYLEPNPAYVDLKKIKTSGKCIFKEEDVSLLIYQGRKYIIYGQDSNLYGCDVTELDEKLTCGKRHFVLVASQIGVVNALRCLLHSDERVKFVYSHSEISVKEFQKNSVDIFIEEKVKKFNTELIKYAKNVANYQHVTLYAKSELTYEQTSKEEELMDQMFRLLRAY